MYIIKCMNSPRSHVTTCTDSMENQRGHGKGVNYAKKRLCKLNESSHSLLFLAKNILSESTTLWNAASSKHFRTVDLAIVIDGLENLMKLT